MSLRAKQSHIKSDLERCFKKEQPYTLQTELKVNIKLILKGERIWERT